MNIKNLLLFSREILFTHHTLRNIGGPREIIGVQRSSRGPKGSWRLNEVLGVLDRPGGPRELWVYQWVGGSCGFQGSQGSWGPGNGSHLSTMPIMRSLIKILKMRGPKIEPWSIPVKISIHLLIADPIFTLFFRFEK